MNNSKENMQVEKLLFKFKIEIEKMNIMGKVLESLHFNKDTKIL